MPKIDESDLDVGNEPPFVARNIVIKKGQNVKNDYAFSDELGRGRFGTVLKCIEKKTGLKLAAKFVSTKQGDERENVEREVDIMKSLQHRRLLQLYDVYDDGKHEMCIITELICGGELFERVIDDDFELTEKVCSIFMRQICEGVDYMHQKLIMHLDMKPENILCVTRTGNRIKLIDFGLARRFDPKKTLQVMFGTPDFASPEVLSYDRVTPAADMWSVGVICYVLLSGLSPFMGNTDLETMSNVTKAIYDFDDDSFDPISAEAKDFISKLLIKEPNRRLKPSECLQHKWLAKTVAKPGTKVTKLSKTKLKKYVVRRRWQKAANAITALRRMGANLSLTGVGGTTSSKGPGPGVAIKRRSNMTSNSSSSSTIRSSTISGAAKGPTQVANRQQKDQTHTSKSTTSSTPSPQITRSGATKSTTNTSSISSTTNKLANENPTRRAASSSVSPLTSSIITPSRASSYQTSSYSSSSSSSYRVTSSSTSSSSTNNRRRL